MARAEEIVRSQISILPVLMLLLAAILVFSGIMFINDGDAERAWSSMALAVAFALPTALNRLGFVPALLVVASAVPAWLLGGGPILGAGLVVAGGLTWLATAAIGRAWRLNETEFQSGTRSDSYRSLHTSPRWLGVTMLLAPWGVGGLVVAIGSAQWNASATLAMTQVAAVFALFFDAIVLIPLLSERREWVRLDLIPEGLRLVRGNNVVRVVTRSAVRALVVRSRIAPALYGAVDTLALEIHVGDKTPIVFRHKMSRPIREITLHVEEHLGVMAEERGEDARVKGRS